MIDVEKTCSSHNPRPNYSDHTGSTRWIPPDSIQMTIFDAMTPKSTAENSARHYSICCIKVSPLSSGSLTSDVNTSCHHLETYFRHYMRKLGRSQSPSNEHDTHFTDATPDDLPSLRTLRGIVADVGATTARLFPTSQSTLEVINDAGSLDSCSSAAPIAVSC